MQDMCRVGVVQVQKARIVEISFRTCTYKNLHYSAASNGNYSETAHEVEGVVVRGQLEPSTDLSIANGKKEGKKYLGIVLNLPQSSL